MKQHSSYVEVTQNLVEQELSKIASRELEMELSRKSAGHCIQVIDFPTSLMIDLCKNLRTLQNSSKLQLESYVLARQANEEYEITPTKLIEKRNDPNLGILVAFIPPDLRTAAEDSFGQSTFEIFSIKDIYHKAIENLVDEIKPEYKGKLLEIIDHPTVKSTAGSERVLRYLIALIQNGFDEEAIGAFLFYLGLFPDLKLASQTVATSVKINKNARAVEILSEQGSSLVRKIKDLEMDDRVGLIHGQVSKDLYLFLKERLKIHDKDSWLKAILDDPDIRKKLTFDKWEFRAETLPGTGLDIALYPLDDLLRPDINSPPIMNLGQQKRLKLKWKVSPPDSELLSKFSIDILYNDTVLASRKCSSSKRSLTIDFSRMFGAGLEAAEEGIYTILLSALNIHGSVIGYDISEPFLVEKGQDETDSPSGKEGLEQKLQFVYTLSEAEVRAFIDYKRREKDLSASPVLVWQADTRKQNLAVLKIKYDNDNTFGLKIIPSLKELELEILSDPESLGMYSIEITGVHRIDSGKHSLISPEGIGRQSQEYEKFLENRTRLFSAIANKKQGENTIAIIELVDLTSLQEEIIDYAVSYKGLLSSIASAIKSAGTGELNNLIELNKQIASIDTIDLFRAETSTSMSRKIIAKLMAPTHPLKLLWLLQYQLFIKSCINLMKNQPKENIQSSLIRDVISKLTNIDFPLTVLDENSRMFANVDNISFFWSLFVPVGTEDMRSLISDIKKLFDLKEEQEYFTVIGPDDISLKIERYLRQHPYVKTLKINVIHPGSGKIMLDTLSRLSQARTDINYDFKFFSPEQRDKMGSAFDDLMTTEGEIANSLQLDELLIASKNPLFPRLTYSKHSLQELEKGNSDLDAHLTFLLDFFKVTLNSRPPIKNKQSSFLHGLINEYVTDFNTMYGTVTWSRQIRPNMTKDILEECKTSSLIYELYSLFNGIICSISKKDEAVDQHPTIQLELDEEQKKIIQRVHTTSDWVVTIDKNFGIEYYDNPFDPYCQVYLIDYTPDFIADIGHRLIVSTQNITELSNIIKPSLIKFGIAATNLIEEQIIRILQSISGRLVLKLLSSPTKATEAISMALARLFMQQTGFLDNQILIPLDSHIDLLKTGQSAVVDRLEDEISLSRTDLLLIGFDIQNSKLCFDLIEIKFREDPSMEVLVDVRQKAKEQIRNTELALRGLYEIRNPDRIDRKLQTKELTTLITFYAERALRHRIISPSEYENILKAAQMLDGPYAVHFSKHVLIFGGTNNSKPVSSDSDEDITFYYLDSRATEIMLRHHAENVGHSSIHNRDLGIDYEHSCKENADVDDHTEIKKESEIMYPPVLKEQEVKKQGPSQAPEPERDVEIIDSKTTIAKQEPRHDIMIGASFNTPQYGLIGKLLDKKVAIDLNGVNTISLFGVQGSGKSYSMGAIVEMALIPIQNINLLQKPLATIVFHYSENETYVPEYINLSVANDNDKEIQKLRDDYEAQPTRIENIVVVVPESKLDKRRQEYPNRIVDPILFDPTELSYNDWLLLMGVPGSDRMYIKTIQLILKNLKSELGGITLNRIESSIEASEELNEGQKRLARTRLRFAGEFLREGFSLQKFVKPGTLVIVDLRNEMLDKDEAMRILIVLLSRFNNVKIDGKNVNKLVVLDEAHKYLQSEFAQQIATVVREMRHQATSVLIASQDPPSVPKEIIELSSVVILHNMTSPDWLKHIKRGVTALESLKPSELNTLQKGEAYLWAKESTLELLKHKAMKINVRPRVTQHGGGTITAL